MNYGIGIVHIYFSSTFVFIALTVAISSTASGKDGEVLGWVGVGITTVLGVGIEVMGFVTRGTDKALATNRGINARDTQDLDRRETVRYPLPPATYQIPTDARETKLPPLKFWVVVLFHVIFALEIGCWGVLVGLGGKTAIQIDVTNCEVELASWWKENPLPVDVLNTETRGFVTATETQVFSTSTLSMSVSTSTEEEISSLWIRTSASTTGQATGSSYSTGVDTVTDITVITTTVEATMGLGSEMA